MESRDEEIRLEDVLDGRTEMDISHGGGEFTDALRQEVEEEYQQKQYVFFFISPF